MTATAPQEVKVRMDRSHDYATVHGERPAGDPHANVHFYQGGLPFDARGNLIPDHTDVLADEKLKAKAAKLIANAAKAKKVAPGNDADADDKEGDGSSENEPVPVNLETWARGEGDWPWLEVTQAIARRFSRRVGNKRDALELLIAEHVVAPQDLSPAFKKLIDAD